MTNDNSNIIDINSNTLHVVQEVICVKCCFRWIACAPSLVHLKEYECTNCGAGYVIKTGQPLDYGE